MFEEDLVMVKKEVRSCGAHRTADHGQLTLLLPRRPSRRRHLAWHKQWCVKAIKWRC